MTSYFTVILSSDFIDGVILESKYSRMDQVKFVDESL